MKVNTRYVDQLLDLNDPLLKSYLNDEIKGTLSIGDSKAQMITYNEKNEAVAIFLQKDEYVLIPSCSRSHNGGCAKGPGPDHWLW